MQAHGRKDAVSSLCRNWRDHRTDHIRKFEVRKVARGSGTRFCRSTDNEPTLFVCADKYGA
jgi:hypothetical protein